MSVDDGVIPGCAGAAALFGLAAECRTQHAAFADDVATPITSFHALHDELAAKGFQLSKVRIIMPPGADAAAAAKAADYIKAPVVPAATYLGAVVGDPQDELKETQTS